MTTSGWQRWAARIVLVTFSTSFVACGGSGTAQPTTTTVPDGATVSVPGPTMPPPPPPAPPPPPPPSPTLPAQPPQQLGKQELRQLVAPVALYPDVVLGSLLPATTFAEQIHDAAAYVGSSDRVDRVPEDRGWDGSIVGLLQFPDVLRWLDENPAWTDEMGQAVTYQQADVLQAIQDYRRSTMDVGNLKSNQYQTVRYVEGQDIRIEPARPDVVYVPSYDPELALQPQPVVVGVNPWIAFGAGAAVGALGAWALYSVFDDDYHHHGGGYGYRRIYHYDNYYYGRGRRPREIGWTPRSRPMRPYAYQRPRRLEYRAASRPNQMGAPLRPPVARPGETRREMQQQNRMDRREQKQERQMQQQQQRQERQQQQRDQRQERQQRHQENRQQQQMERQQRQQGQTEQRQRQWMQRHQQRQERQQGQMQRQQRQLQQRQDNRQQQQQQRQENRQQRHEGGGGGGDNKKKKQQHH